MILLDEDAGATPAPEGVTAVPLAPPRRLYGPLEPLAELGRSRTVAALAREHEVDGIHATRPGLLLAPGPKAVITLWDPIPDPLDRARAGVNRGEGRVKEGLWALSDRLAARRAKAVVAVTPEVQAAYSARGSHCELIPPFLADTAVAPAQPDRPDDVVMAAGALDLPRKGLDLALAAFELVRAELPDARLILIGPWVEAARRDALPPFCEPRGRLPREQVTAAFAAAGCALVPSQWEEFGYVGLEALASGVPVACTPGVPYSGLSGGGVFRAAEPTAAALAAEIVAALRVRDFEYPAECRAANAIPRLERLYTAAFGT